MNPKANGSRLGDDQWLNNFHLLERFIGESGRLPFRSEEYEGVKLGNWVVNQKSFYKRGTLSDFRRVALERVGIEFDDRQRNEIYEAQWLKKYQLLKEYVSEKGILPARSVEYKGVYIGTWLGTQRNKFGEGLLSDDKVKLFEDIGVNLDVSGRDEKWDAKYQVLKKYVGEYGCIPRFDVVYNGMNIGRWVYYQGENYNNGSLSVAHKELLESLGVDFLNAPGRAREARWNQYLEFLRGYLVEYGELPDRDAEYQGVVIGKWLKEKVSAYESGRLSDARFDSLLQVACEHGFDSADLFAVLSNKREREYSWLDDTIAHAKIKASQGRIGKQDFLSSLEFGTRGCVGK